MTVVMAHTLFEHSLENVNLFYCKQHVPILSCAINIQQNGDALVIKVNWLREGV